MKYVIIGNSAAGTAAIEAIRKYDNRSSIVQLTDEIVRYTRDALFRITSPGRLIRMDYYTGRRISTKRRMSNFMQ